MEEELVRSAEHNGRPALALADARSDGRVGVIRRTGAGGALGCRRPPQPESAAARRDLGTLCKNRQPVTRASRYQRHNESPWEDEAITILDKLSGRTKKAVGDLADDPSLRREGRDEERKGEAKERLAKEQDRADRTAEEVSDLERRTP